MRISEQKLQEEYSEIRPNRYVALAFAVLSAFIIGMLLNNEAGFFLVVKSRMRLGAFASLIILEIPMCIAGSDSGQRDPKTKYFLVVSAGATTAILSITLNFHATLILLLPMLLAAQYPSVRLSRISILCSLVCAFFCPLVGYLSGMWDTAFLTRLCEISGMKILQAAANEQMPLHTALLQIILYLSFPHTMILLAISPLVTAIAHGSEKRLQSQIQVLHMSESDSLTGVFNRLRYELAIENEVTSAEGTVAIVYVDANDLHRINNEYGHSEGDHMLICVAESLQNAFGNECVYRIGGDEFIAIVYGISLQDARRNLSQVKSRVDRYGYSIAAGLEYSLAPCTLPALITSAEAKMQIDKRRYHIKR